MDEEEWRSRLVQAVAQQVRRRRLELGLSVQKLADICAEQYGLPIKRSVLANFEGGRRPALSVVELIVLARILAIPPVELLFPVGREDQAEVLPGTSADSWEALKWFTGESDRLPSDDQTSQDTRAVQWYRNHEQLVSEWWSRRQELQVTMATEGRTWLDSAETKANPEVARQLIELKADAMRGTENSITLLRQQMRDAGLTPPHLGPAAAYLEPDSSPPQTEPDSTKGEPL